MQRPPNRPLYRPIGPTSRELMLKPGYRKNIISAKNAIPLNRLAASAPVLQLPPPISIPTANIIQEKTEEKPIQPFTFISNFIFTEEQIRNSPSFRKHKISNEDEIILRRAGTCFIKQLTSRINANFEQKRQKISARATCMAMVYFHRFYMYHSLTTFLPLEMATTCLFLASKCEDCPKAIALFSRYYYCLTHNDDELEKYEYEIVNDLIQAYETKLLQTLAFEFRIELPHIAVINSAFHSESDHLKKIAFRFSTDMLAFTTLCLQYDEKVLAAAAFFVAGAYLDIDMKKQYGETWLQSIAPLLTDDVLMKIVNVFVKALKDTKIIIQSKRYELEEGEIY